MATVTVEDSGPCKKLIKITVPSDEIGAKIEESYKKLRESVDVDGFRKGRVPRKLLERRFGEKVIEEVKETAMGDACQKALDDNELTSIGEPSFDNVEHGEDGDLSFEVTIEVKPQFDLPDYVGLKLKRARAEVSDQDLAEGLERIRMQRASLDPVEGGEVQAGDRVTADWEATCGDEDVASEMDVPLQVAGRLMGPMQLDLVACLQGAKAGETREGDVTFAQSHPTEKYRGQAGRISIAVKDIRRPVAPELSDDFAKELDFDSIDELKDVVRSQLASRKQRELQEDLERQISDQLLESIVVELPEDLVKRQASDLLMRQQLRMRHEGEADDQIEERTGQMQAASEEAAERQFRMFFIHERIAEKEKIFITENDVENRIGQLANSYRLSVQQMRNYLEERNGLSQLRIQMREERVMGLLLSKADIQDAD